MPKAQKHCKLQCVAAFGPHQKTIQIYQKVTLAAAPCLFVLRSPKTWKLQPESRIFEGSASRRHERQPDLQCCSDLKSFLEWWATIGKLQRHCWIWGLERKGLDGCGCGLRHNYGCCPCLICNLGISAATLRPSHRNTPSDLHPHGVSTWRAHSVGPLPGPESFFTWRSAVMAFRHNIPRRAFTRMVFRRGGSKWPRSLAWCFSVAGPAFWTSAWAQIFLYLFLAVMAFRHNIPRRAFTRMVFRRGGYKWPGHSHGVSAWRARRFGPRLGPNLSFLAFSCDAAALHIS